MERKEVTTEHSQSRRGLDTVDWFSLYIGSICSRNAFTVIITIHCFKYSYFYQGFCDFTVSDIIVSIHTKDNIIPLVTEITQELAQTFDE